MKFSVITPSYNQLSWLEKAMASVKDQVGTGSFAVEHLIQDAGTPGIELVAETSAESGPYRRKVFVEKDGGMYDAINRGLKKSSGDICAWLNCDEQYLPGTLARVAEYFQRHPEIDVLFGDALLVDGEGEALSYRRSVPPGLVHTRLVHLNTLSCSTFFRRSVVERGFLFETRWRMIGDAVWVHDMLKAGVAMGTLAEVLAVFAFTGVNQSESDRAKKESEAWREAPDAPFRGLRWPAILVHRLRKAWGGAYRRREVEYEIFARESGGRKKFRASGLGWNWPGARQSGLN